MNPLTTTPRNSLLALAILSLLASCYRTAKDPSVDKRLAAIEQRLDAQDKAVAEMRSRADTTELSLLSQQIAALSAQVAELAAKTPAARPTRPHPDPAAIYSVPLGVSPVFGSPKAKVTLVMAFEFACQYCRRAWGTVDELAKKYGKDLRVAYKQYVVHPAKAMAPAYAACAAAKQGPAKFRKLADLMWARAFDAANFEPSNIDAITKDAGLDMSKYAADMAACPQEVKDDNDRLKKLGVGATPTFYINGRFLEGALPIEKFQALIDEELAKATAAQKNGIKAERYYEDEIVAKGATELATP